MAADRKAQPRAPRRGPTVDARPRPPLEMQYVPSPPPPRETPDSLSHALRTPLHVVMGFTQLLREQQCGPLTPRQLQCLDEVLAASRQLLGVIRDRIEAPDDAQQRDRAEPRT